MKAEAFQAVRERYLPANHATVRFVRFFSKARAWLFGFVFGLFTDGVSFSSSKMLNQPLGVRVPLPAGPLIVVSNHRSHADSAVLISLIGRSRPVLVVADAGYWLADSATELLSRTLIGIWPIRKDTEHAWADLEDAAELVRNGVVLIIFAEGTRSRDGKLGKIHSGAFRLAAQTNANLVTATINGTEALLPVTDGKFSRTALKVRFGETQKIENSEAGVEKARKQARSELEAGMANPVQRVAGRGWQRAHTIASSWIGSVVVFAWALGEGTVWPLIAEMPLLLLIGSVGPSWKALRLLLASAIGSASGILLSWYLFTRGMNFWLPLTTQPMFTFANAQLSNDPHGAFWAQMWNGIPVKVYAHEAATLGLSFSQVIGASLPRLLRVFIVGGLGFVGGLISKRWIQSCLGIVQVVSLILFPLGLALSIAYWSVTR